MVPDHELIRPIGRGSYGEVWLARSVLGEYRAVKIMRRDAFDRDRPLERELEGIQKFEPISRTHEHQVHILHVGRFHDGFYYVMELADDASQPSSLETAAAGARSAKRAETAMVDYIPKTLRGEVRRRGRLPVTECLELALKLTEALGHLHGHGLVHRDIKPSNIIFVRGRPKLADIGLVASSDASMSCVGTEGFLPPEGPGKPQADLYALGKVLYEISTGRDRHDFPELPTMLRESPERRELEELNEVILKACDPNARTRYATARAMNADLALLESGKSLRGARRRQRHWAFARRVAAGAALAAGLLALVDSRRAPSRDGSRHLPIPLAVDGAEFWRGPFMPRQFDFSPDGERIVFAGKNLISIWEQKTRMTRRLELRGMKDWKIAGAYGALAMPRWAPNSRQFVFQAVKTLNGSWQTPELAYGLLLVNSESGEISQIGPDLQESERAADICWRPDGEALTYVFSAKRLMTLSLGGQQTVWKDSELAGAQHLLFGGYSPDGAWLAISALDRRGSESDRSDIWVLPHLGGPGKRITDRLGVDACPTWGPDPGTVFFVSAGGHRQSETWGLWKVGLDSATMLPRGNPAEVLVRTGSRFLHPRFVAGGQTLLYAVQEPKTDIWVSRSDALENGTIAARGQDPVLSPDGETIFFVGERADQQGVFAINRDGAIGSLRKVTGMKPLARGDTLSGLNLSRDGELLALFGYDGKQHGVFVTPASGGEPRLVEAAPLEQGSVPVWSPDGRWLAYTVDRQLVLVSRDGRVREQLASAYRWLGFSLRWSPDGKYLAGFANTTAHETYEKSGIYVVSLSEKSVKRLNSASEDKEKEGLEWHPSSAYLTYMFYGPERSGAQIRRAYLDGRPTDLMIDQPDHWDYVGLWAPDGRRFFFNAAPKANEKPIHLYDAETGQIKHGLWGGSLNALPRWSSNGRAAVWAIEETLRYFEKIERFNHLADDVQK